MINFNTYLNNYCTHLYDFVSEINTKSWFTDNIFKPEYKAIRKEYLKLIFLAYKTSILMNHQDNVADLLKLRTKIYSFIENFNQLHTSIYTVKYLKTISELSKVKN